VNYPYLDQLPVSDDVRAKLVGLAASTPAALLAMIRASPHAFFDFLGKPETDRLAASLEEMLEASQRALLATPAPTIPSLGAIIERRPPALKKPAYDITERDRLFAELQELRRTSDATPQYQHRIQQLEAALNEMLETA